MGKDEQSKRQIVTLNFKDEAEFKEFFAKHFENYEVIEVEEDTEDD